MEETFRTIKQFEDYQVSNLGRIISNKNGKPKFLNPQTDKLGYQHVRLYPIEPIFGRYENGNIIPKLEKVHRLVALAFIDKPTSEDFWEVNHKDCNKRNNSVENLEWVTRQENLIHSWASGHRDNSALIAGPKKWKPLKVFTPDGDVHLYQSRIHASLDLNIGTSAINHFLVHGKPAKYGRVKGYRFVDAPDTESNAIFKKIEELEEKLKWYREEINPMYKELARQRREKNLNKKINETK